jgi:hypothetical protein
MANTKISQLPSYTGTAKDLRWFVMNNSGESTTFKFSGYTSPFVLADGSNSVRSIYFASNKNLSPNGVLIGGLNTNQILSTGNYNTIIGGEGATITSGEDNGIFAAKNSTTNASSSYSTIIGGRTHTINNQFGFIGGGAQNTAGYLSATISGFNINASNQSHIMGGENNTASGAYGGIFGGTSNTATGNYSHIIGGSSSNTNSKTRAIMLGTSGRTATTDTATFVENLVIFNYAALNYSGDTAAAAGGVVLGQVYHNAGALRIRIV